MLPEGDSDFSKELLPEVEVTCIFRLDIPFISGVNYNIHNLRKKTCKIYDNYHKNKINRYLSLKKEVFILKKS